MLDSKLRPIIASVCVLAAAGVGNAQSRDARGPMGEIPRQDPTVARDPLASRHRPPPDDPGEKDLSKRKRFIWEIGQARIGWFSPPELFKPAKNEIPEGEMQDLLADAAFLLPNHLHAPNDSSVQWYAYRGTYAKPDAPDGVEQRLETIQAEWAVNDYVIVVSRNVASDRTVDLVSFRIRLPKRPQLEFFDRPERLNHGQEGYRDWEFVSRVELVRLTNEFFGSPRRFVNAIERQGQLSLIDGVRVYAAGEGPILPGDVERKQAECPGCPTLVRIMVTDSDPQYFGGTFELQKQSP